MALTKICIYDGIYVLNKLDLLFMKGMPMLAWQKILLRISFGIKLEFDY